ncbi:MAG: hypothetical protein KC417_06225 [Myxococcales bacterium]|nr:hypothetical protein [Myxococcales bacterium]
MHRGTQLFLAFLTACVLIAVTTPRVMADGRATKAADDRPNPEPAGDTLHREGTNDDGTARLSYPGRTPRSIASDPGLRPHSHFTMLMIQLSAGLSLWAAGSALSALAFCDNWSDWIHQIFTRSVCGTVPLVIGSVLLWGGITLATSVVHGPTYDGTRPEALALVALGTLLGAGLAGVLYAVTDERAVLGPATILFPLAGAIGFAELAAHQGTTDATQTPFTRLPVGFSVTGSSVTGSVSVSF